jgi:hypothetical protein
MKRMSLPVNKGFTTSFFDLDGGWSFDGAAEPVDRPLCSAVTLPFA